MTSPFPAPDAAALARFAETGCLRIDHAFSADLAAEIRARLWQKAGLDPDAHRWDRPVIRLPHEVGAPFTDAGNTPLLHRWYDALLGPGGWRPLGAMGGFVLRFPADAPPGDDGWHVDASLDWHLPDFMDWRITRASEGRALLMLVLFSDSGPADAPTRIRVGSHRIVARSLDAAGPRGMTQRELLPVYPQTEGCEEVLATGPAGTVWLCHPFLVHSAQRGQAGGRPRFMAQPGLMPATDAPAPESVVMRSVR